MTDCLGGISRTNLLKKKKIFTSCQLCPGRCVKYQGWNRHRGWGRQAREEKDQGRPLLDLAGMTEKCPSLHWKRRRPREVCRDPGLGGHCGCGSGGAGVSVKDLGDPSMHLLLKPESRGQGSPRIQQASMGLVTKQVKDRSLAWWLRCCLGASHPRAGVLALLPAPASWVCTLWKAAGPLGLCAHLGDLSEA